LAKFDISNNDIREEGTQALAKALQGNQSITELNVSSNSMSENAEGYDGKMAGVTALADVIPGMGALTSLNLSSNNIGKADEEQVEKDTEVLLQSFGTGIEALQEHFEETEPGSTAASVSMVSTQRFEHPLSPVTLPFSTRLLQTDCCCP
jgi:hypothetical protein